MGVAEDLVDDDVLGSDPGNPVEVAESCYEIAWPEVEEKVSFRRSGVGNLLGEFGGGFW